MAILFFLDLIKNKIRLSSIFSFILDFLSLYWNISLQLFIYCYGTVGTVNEFCTIFIANS